MKFATKFTQSISLLVLCSGYGICSNVDGVTLYALSCKINVPNGYEIWPDYKGVIHATYSVIGSPQILESPIYPVFEYDPTGEYDPTVSQKDRSPNEDVEYLILSEEQLGRYRFLEVKYDINRFLKIEDLQGNIKLIERQPETWYVITTHEAHFSSIALFGTFFVDQFRLCAKESANKSLNTDVGDADAG